MRCEVIAVGTELLLGQIVDSNSAWLGEQLALAGIDSFYQTRVGDNQGRIVASIRLALERGDAVIMTGGLGPTQDDITREAIAEVMGVALERDEAMGQRIREMFERRGRRFAENNLRQADKPAGARFIAEMPGTAPGLLCPIGDKVIYAVPGVPHEMREMVNGTILPDLHQRSGITAVIRSRVLRTWGESESGLAELLQPRIEALDRSGDATLAFQASGIEGLKIRITAKAETEMQAMALIEAEEREVRAIVGDIVFGLDDTNMETAVLQLLRERGLSLAVAETATGGLLSARLSEIHGAEEILRGAVVAADDRILAAQFGLTRIPTDAYAQTYAERVRQRFQSDVGIAAVSGDTGNGTSDVVVGVALPDHEETKTVRLPGDRRRIRQFGVISALNLLRLRLTGSMREAVMR